MRGCDMYMWQYGTCYIAQEPSREERTADVSRCTWSSHVDGQGTFFRSRLLQSVLEGREGHELVSGEPLAVAEGADHLVLVVVEPRELCASLVLQGDTLGRFEP